MYTFNHMINIANNSESYACSENGVTAILHNGDYCQALTGQFNLVFTSPPYNIGSSGPAKIRGLRHIGIFDPKSYRGITDYADCLPEDAYQEQQRNFLIWCSEHLKPGGVVVYNHKDRRKDRCMISPEKWFPSELTLVDRVIWNRKSTHNHDKTQLWGHTEFLYVLKRAQDKRYYFDNAADDDTDSRSNLWTITKEASWHNASFPLKLAQRVVRKWCPAQGLVCDPYMGSGTTMAASIELKRNFIGSEIKSTFFSKCVERLNICMHTEKDIYAYTDIKRAATC